MNVVIFGAGPCGLTAAWELSKQGIQVTVIEKNSVVGGLCKTVRQDGYQFDLGGHRFISKDSELIESIKLLMGDSMLTRNRKSVIRFKDFEYDYPINVNNILSESTVWMNCKFAGGYLASRIKQKKHSTLNKSFNSWINYNFGEPLNNFFFKPYTEKLWGISANHLSSDWAAQRISLLNAKDAIVKSIHSNKDNKPRTYAAKYLYPKKGIGAIFEKMGDEIIKLGGKIITCSNPIRLKYKDKKVAGVTIKNSSGKNEYIEADRYLSTIPLDELVKISGISNVPKLSYRSLRFLNIKLNRENLSHNTWIYVPEKEFIMTRIQEPKHRSPFSAPKGKTSVMLEIPCEKDDTIWNMHEEHLLEKVLKDLKVLGFDISKDVIGFFSTKTQHAYPRYELGYSTKVKLLSSTINNCENLSSIGRQGLFRYIFMDISMIMGRNWARSVLQYPNNFIEETDNKPGLIEAHSVI